MEADYLLGGFAFTFMNTKIDLKSALFGLGLGVLVTFAIAAASSPGTVGRYQIAGAGDHGLVLDTATGQVWSGVFLFVQWPDRQRFLPAEDWGEEMTSRPD